MRRQHAADAASHEFIGFMRDVAEALAAAHRSGVIHRDLKPTNIFLHKDRDGRVVPKILDFGVSKILEEENNTALTVVGTVLGSPLYMSPEQAMGAEGIDGRTDVFAFGAILFEALSGQRAFDAPNFNALIVTIATKQPKRIDDVAPHLPEPLRALVRDCLVTDKAKRLDSFDRIVEQLDAMMPELAKSDLRLAQPNRAETALGGRSRDERAIGAAERPAAAPVAAPAVDRTPPPASIPTVELRAWRRRACGATGPSRAHGRDHRGHARGGGASILVLVAAFSRSDEEPHAAAATRGDGRSRRVSGGAAAPKIAAPPARDELERRAGHLGRLAPGGDAQRARARERQRAAGDCREPGQLLGLGRRRGAGDDAARGPRAARRAAPDRLRAAVGQAEDRERHDQRGRRRPGTSSRSTNEATRPPMTARSSAPSPTRAWAADGRRGHRAATCAASSRRAASPAEDVDAILAAPTARACTGAWCATAWRRSSSACCRGRARG